MIKQPTRQRGIRRMICWTLLGILFLCHSAFSQEQFVFESFRSTENKALKGFVFQVINDVHSYFQCYRECDDHRACFSVNFYPSKGVCELNYASHISHPDNMADDEDATYLFNLAKKGSGIHKNCKMLKQFIPSLPSGNYWLDVDLTGPKAPFLGYCDMETDGGGWTLVWSFTFGNYKNFDLKTNYIKPAPKGMFTDALEESNTPPKNETDMNAIVFDIWKDIGSEFLVKSNINNWVACAPNVGSLVTKTAGSLNCSFIKQIVTEKPNCKEVPGKILLTLKGFIGLYGKTTNTAMYLFVPIDQDNWPTHDPCAMREPNHKKNVENPHTNVYLR